MIDNIQQQSYFTVSANPNSYTLTLAQNGTVLVSGITLNPSLNSQVNTVVVIDILDSVLKFYTDYAPSNVKSIPWPYFTSTTTNYNLYTSSLYLFLNNGTTTVNSTSLDCIIRDYSVIGNRIFVFVFL